MALPRYRRDIGVACPAEAPAEAPLIFGQEVANGEGNGFRTTSRDRRNG